jgi:hypothetical protein
MQPQRLHVPALLLLLLRAQNSLYSMHPTEAASMLALFQLSSNHHTGCSYHKNNNIKKRTLTHKRGRHPPDEPIRAYVSVDQRQQLRLLLGLQAP